MVKFVSPEEQAYLEEKKGEEEVEEKTFEEIPYVLEDKDNGQYTVKYK